MGKHKRHPLSKTVRFEVFKRDSFTCQYCGNKAPEVILHIDHIKPVSKGGNNDLVNLITACVDCNQGKGARLLTENQSLDKMKKQAEDLQKRREQLELMMKWVEGLNDIDNLQIDSLNNIWKEKTGSTFNNQGRKSLIKYIKKYGYIAVADAIQVAIDQYVKYDSEGNAIEYTIKLAFNKILGICYNKNKLKEDPEFAELYRINFRFYHKLPRYNFTRGLRLLMSARYKGASIKSLDELVSKVRDFNHLKAAVETFCYENEDE